MKKSDIILIGILVVVALISLLLIQNKGEVNTGKTSSNMLTEISYSDYEEKINNGEKFIVIIERTGCSYCEKYMPIVKKVANEKDTKIYYIDTSNLEEDEFNKLSASNDYLSSNEWGTPTTLLLEGSSVIDSISGYVEKAEFVSFLEDNNIIE